MVIRKVFYEETKKNIVLECPSTSQSSATIRWQNGTTVINPMTIRRQTRGRVKVDSVNRLHIHSLRLYDTAAFNCWIKRRHVATIKLIVTEAFNHNIKDYITYVGLGMTIVCMVLVCCCVCCGKQRQMTR